jgi:hypothetical protein
MQVQRKEFIMLLGISTELLFLIAAGALGASILEGAFGRDALSRLIAHIVAPALLLIAVYVRYSSRPMSIPELMAAVTSKPALYFIGISAAIASILEVFLRRHVLFRFVAHFVALLAAVWLLD